MSRQGTFQLQGLDGGRVINAASGTVTGEFRWVTVLEDAVLDGYVGNLVDGDTIMVGPTLLQGFGWGGITTSIDVASGSVIAYEMT